MFSIHVDIRDAERGLTLLERDQMPFAMSQALNDTGSDIADAWRADMRSVFDRPTPFTLRGPHLQRRATKRRLTAVAAIRPIQSEYLRIQVTGGTRTPEGSALLVPAGARRNRYGNLPRNYVRTLISSGRGFVASRSDPRTAHLPPGIYRRRKVRGKWMRPELMVAFEDDAQYTQRFDPNDVALRVARRRFSGHMARRFSLAMATRR